VKKLWNFLRPQFTIDCNQLVFDPVSSFQPSLMFVGKTCGLKSAPLGKAPALRANIRRDWKGPPMKHTLADQSRKKFNDNETWLSVGTKVPFQ